jgi:glutaredoxin
MTSVRLFVTPGCDVCRRAEEALLAEGLPFEKIDVAREPSRLPAGVTCAPAIEIDGRVLFKGEPNRVLLRRVVANRAKSSAGADPA